jgi:hypothetical protein
MTNSISADDVAAWMVGELDRVNFLDQESAVWKIKQNFGDAFVYTNENGNLAIGKDVLAAFRKLTGDNVVWERGSRTWRKRAGYDQPGRRGQQ